MKSLAYLHRGSKKVCNEIFVLTSNVDRFLKLFYHRTVQEFCNKAIVKYTNFNSYARLRYFMKCYYQKTNYID